MIIFILFLGFMDIQATSPFLPTDKINLTYFNIIKKAYNEGNSAQIYRLLSKAAQDQITLDNFASQIQGIKDRQGNIEYSSYSTINPQKPSVLIGFQKHLGTGTLFWSYDDQQKLNSFSLNDHIQPSMVQWMIHFPEKFSLTAIADNNIISNFFGEREQSIMSVFKIIIAIEFCKQLSEGQINGEIRIDLEEVNKFYIEDVDIYHKTFLQVWEQKGLIKENQIQLIEIARGMIALSSNACTEFLQTLLTVEAIEKTAKELELKHFPIYYICSIQLVFLNNDHISDADYDQKIKDFDPNFLTLQSLLIHNVLVQNDDQAKLWRSQGKDLLNPKIIGIWPKYFPVSTTMEYARLMNILNNRELYSNNFYDQFYALLGYVSLQNPALAKEYNHVGIKAGSSAYPDVSTCVLSVAYFQELKVQAPFKRTSIAFFIQQLEFKSQYQVIFEQYNEFIALTSLNGHYLQEVSKYLNQSLQNANV